MPAEISNSRPWQTYWKALEKEIDLSLPHLPPPPFAYPQGVVEWIARSTFVELMHCDTIAKVWVKWTEKNLTVSTIKGDPPNIAWQWIFRLEYALDFCKGNIGKRKQFDWNRLPKEIYGELLIDQWRSGAIYWANRRITFDDSHLRLMKAKSQLHKHIFLKGGKIGLN